MPRTQTKEPKARRPRSGLTAADLALLDKVADKWQQKMSWGEIVRPNRARVLRTLCGYELATSGEPIATMPAAAPERAKAGPSRPEPPPETETPKGQQGGEEELP